MQKTIPQNSRFHGGVAVYGFLLMFFMYTFVKSLYSLFLVPVTESLGMERSAFSLITTIFGLSLAAALPVVTKLLKRYPARRVISVCIIMTAGGFAAFSLARTAWQFYILALIVGCGTAGCTNMMVSLLINNWFSAHRASVLGLALTGCGFGVAILSPVLTAILESFGWQTAYVFCGSVMALVCLPMTFLFAYQKPAERGLQPYRGKQAAMQTQEITVLKREEAQGPLLEDIRGKVFFWIYLAAVFFWCVTFGGVHSHLAAYLTDLGHSAGFVAMIFSGQALCAIGAKLIVGAVFDTKGTLAGTLFLAVSFGLALICLLLAESPVLGLAFAVFYGGGSIFVTMGVPNLTSGFFGQRNYADILSMTNVAAVFGEAIASYISGIAYDITGSYQMIFIVYLLMFLAAAVTLCYLERRYK